MKTYFIAFLLLISSPSYASLETYAIEWIELHQAKGLECFENAKTACIALEDTHDREEAIESFEFSYKILGYTVPNARLVKFILTYMVTAGLDLNDDWDKIETYLEFALYHFEMVEYYQDILARQI